MVPKAKGRHLGVPKTLAGRVSTRGLAGVLAPLGDFWILDEKPPARLRRPRPAAGFLLFEWDGPAKPGQAEPGLVPDLSQIWAQNDPQTPLPPAKTTLEPLPNQFLKKVMPRVAMAAQKWAIFGPKLPKLAILRHIP